MTPRRTLILIALFVAFMLGNFLWFILTWTAEAEAPVGSLGAPAPLHFAITIPAGGSDASTLAALAKDSAA